MVCFDREEYPTTRFNALKTGYYNKPTPLQVASFGSHVVKIVRKRDEEKLRKYLSAGLSPNPSNKFGESMVHLACRLNNVKMLKVMLECGTNVQVCDDNGRTTLHDACWSPKPCFELIELILKVDADLLFVSDMREALPLSYAPRATWDKWLRFLESKKDVFWPKRNENVQIENLLLNPMTLAKPNTSPIVDPINALPLSVASVVATGKLDLDEVSILMSNELDDELSYEDDDDSDGFDLHDEENEVTECSFENELLDTTSSTIDTENIVTIPYSLKLRDEAEKSSVTNKIILGNGIHMKEQNEEVHPCDDDMSVTEYEMTEILKNFGISGQGAIRWSIEKPLLGQRQ